MTHERNLGLLAPVMDVEGALKRLGNDLELLEQIIQIFLEDAPGLVHGARQALARGDAAELRRAAHSVKGMMATLGAQAGVTAALRLEQGAASGDLADASTLIHECGGRVSELAQLLQQYLTGTAGAAQARDSASAP